MCNHQLKNNVYCESAEQDSVCEDVSSSITPGSRWLWDGEHDIALFAWAIALLLWKKE